MQLVCPAGSLPALKAAVRQGADAIYVGFRDDTNARHCRRGGLARFVGAAHQSALRGAAVDRIQLELFSIPAHWKTHHEIDRSHYQPLRAQGTYRDG